MQETLGYTIHLQYVLYSKHVLCLYHEVVSDVIGVHRYTTNI